jgi:hypothetical protein
MLLPGTPALPPPGPGHEMAKGQAFMNFSWYECTAKQAAKLALDLPDSGGRLIVPFDVQAASSPVCDGGSQAVPPVQRGPFSPLGFDWPPPPDVIALAITMSPIDTVKRGSVLTYYVTIRNEGDRDYVLTPCPDYVELLGPKSLAKSYQLNCAPVGHVAQGRSVVFQMRAEIPSNLAAGPSTFAWSLIDGRVGVAYAKVPVEVT